MAIYDLTPVDVPLVETKYRSIKTKIPVPESLEIYEKLIKSEPQSMQGQPPIIWDKAEDFTIYDKWGNRWIDWSSGVLVTNVGHGRREIKESLRMIIDKGLLATYVFVHEKRAELTEMLRSVSPDPENYKVFLLSTGSEATENCIKLSKTYALEKYGSQKKYLISYVNSFHGRTMGAQLAGGIEGLKTWLGENRDETFIQVPFPDGYRTEDVSFEFFLDSLKERGIKAEEIAGIMSESYQGVGAEFMPAEYAKKLEAFCREYDIVLSMDEVQAGFGRSGKFWSYNHYGITPDLIACGKGITSSLPLSAVIGRSDIMEIYSPGSMTSTHSASPLPVAAAIANLKILQEENLTENAEKLGKIMMHELSRIQKKYSENLGVLFGKGLVAAIQCVKLGTKEPDPEISVKINIASFQKGLLMFAPVGLNGGTLKIVPPLNITEEALRESLTVFGEAVDEILG
jgi:4-aminobutyrate aminotransferase/diaminobutyrate-pyruvate transaminase/4-aminobutyrate aminotransferase/(S)-3-amino-2-methylpropionate transaminase